MNETAFMCPNCREPLETEDRSLVCPAGHSFDLAREGYVNLLTGKAPGPLQGDSAEMVRSRRAFLEHGLYEPLVEALARAVSEAVPQIVADFGCGEGYYLGQLMELPELAGAHFYGTDISKPAIAAAAKRYPNAHFAVADTNRLIPLPDAGVDVGLCVFAPRNAQEFARVMRPGGRLVVAVPGPGHLAQLRERFGLLGIEADKPAKIQAQLSDFELAETIDVGFELSLDSSALGELVEMTPNARHVSDQTQAAIAATDEAQTAAEFQVLVFTRT